MMKYKILACDIIEDEIEFLKQNCPHELDISYLTRDGYHTQPRKSRALLQEQIDKIPEGYDAILLGFALCNKLIEGITARHTKIVVPRAHDCITFALGSREKYRESFDKNPGTYYYTSGWLKRRDGAQLWQVMDELPGMGGMTYEDMLEKFGEDNADYLMDFFGSWQKNYKQGVLIKLPVADNLALKEQVEEICKDHQWNYGEVEGSLELLRKWLVGEWDGDFLIVEPGQSIMSLTNEQIITNLHK